MSIFKFSFFRIQTTIKSSWKADYVALIDFVDYLAIKIHIITIGISSHHNCLGSTIESKGLSKKLDH